MNADERREELNWMTERIIGAAFTVHNVLGCRFLEKVYENALAHELRKMGFIVQQKHPVPVYYDGIQVGCYFADLFVNSFVIVETKAMRAIDEIHQAQTL